MIEAIIALPPIIHIVGGFAFAMVGVAYVALSDGGDDDAH